MESRIGPGEQAWSSLRDICVFGAAVCATLGALEVFRGNAVAEFRPLGLSHVTASLAVVLAVHLSVGALQGALAYFAARWLRLLGYGNVVTPWLLVGCLLLLAPSNPIWHPMLSRWPPRFRDVAAVSGAAVLIAMVAFRRGNAPGRMWHPIRRLSTLATALFVTILCALVIVSAATGRDGDDGSERPDIVLISLDTVRADHLELYEYPRITAPHLTRFAAEAVVFENAYAPEPWTLPSHMTMMTSLLPIRHRVTSPTARLDDSHETLASRLKASGYLTAAFVSHEPSSYIGGSRGFAKGFDVYRHPSHWRSRTFATSVMEFVNRHLWRRRWGTARDVTEAALDFLARPAKRPFFLFLHYFDAHSDTVRLPYESSDEDVLAASGSHERHFDGCGASGECATRYLYSFGPCTSETPASELTRADIEDIVSHYDAGILGMDRELGRLLSALSSTEWRRRALVVITSDHGEAFLEHGRFQHTQLYEELLHVPLIVRMPGGEHAGARIESPVQHSDLAPSLLESAGAQPLMPSDGRSFLPLLDGSPTGPRTLFFSRSYDQGTTEIALLRGRTKLRLPIQSRCSDEETRPDAAELYDLSADPEEQNDIESSNASTARALSQELLSWYRSLQPSSPGDVPTLPLDKEMRMRLEALGYLDPEEEPN